MLLHRAISPLILLALSVGAASENEVHTQLVPASKGKAAIAYPSSPQFLTAARSLTHSVPTSTAYHQRFVRRRRQDRQLKSDKKSKGPKSSKTGKAPKGPKSSKTTKSNKKGHNPVDIDKELKNLEDKCYDRIGEVCVFFGNYINPDESTCKCRPVAFTPDELNPVGIFSVKECEANKKIASTWISIGAVLLGVGIAWATFCANCLPVLGSTIAWAVIGQAPGIVQEGVNLYSCGSKQNNEMLLVEFEKTEAYIGQDYDQENYMQAVERINSLNTYLEPFSALNFTIPLYEVNDIIGKVKEIQIIASRAKISGAELVAQMGIMQAMYYMQKMKLENKLDCTITSSDYKNNLKESIRLLKDIKTGFERLFEKEVTCKQECRSGGCFCVFCSDKNINAVCNSDVANSKEYNFYVANGECGNCGTLGKKKQIQAQNRAQASWTAAVNKWWSVVKPNYDILKELLKNADELSNMCGQRCGPEANDQLCQCGVLPYCNSDIGGCDIKASENPIDRQYDAPGCLE